MELEGCSNDLLTEVQPSGKVGASCMLEKKAVFKFFVNDNCVGDTYRQDYEMFYDTCYPDASGGS